MTTKNQVRHAFPAWRVFVFGQEVTDDVTSCVINTHDGDAPNTCEFELVNPYDRYIITPADIGALYSDLDLRNTTLPNAEDVLRDFSSVSLANVNADALTSFTAGAGASELENSRFAARGDFRAAQARDHIDRLTTERIIREIADPIKSRVLNAKYKASRVNTNIGGLAVSTTEHGDGVQDLIDSAFGTASRYSVQTGDCIFQGSDPVRVFWRDPFDPTRWYHMFTGWVTDTSESVSANDERVVRVRCEDVTRVLRYARITTNASVSTLDEQTVKGQDTALRTFTNEGFANMSLPEFLFMLVFGSEQGTPGSKLSDTVAAPAIYSRVGVEGSSTDYIPLDAQGAFNVDRSLLVYYGTEYDGLDGAVPHEAAAFRWDLIMRLEPQQLPAYLDHVSHEVRVDDLDTMFLRNGPADQLARLKRQVQYDTSGNAILSSVIDVIGRNPHLFPVDGGRLLMLMPASIGPLANRDLLLKDLVGPALVGVWRTRLALIYDAMKRVNFSFYASPRGDLLCEMPLCWTRPADLGLHAPTYRMDKANVVSWDRAYQDNNIRTQMNFRYNNVAAYSGLGDSGGFGVVGSVRLWSLIPKYGVRAEDVDPMGVISTYEAGREYALLRLDMINGDARSAHYTCLPRVQLAFPNRPVEFTERVELATIRSVTHRLTWGAQGDMTMDLDVNYVRGWSGQVDDNNDIIYEWLGGMLGHGVDYAQRWGRAFRGAKNDKSPST